MTLSALIRKRDTGNHATAIPAISATQPKGEAATVARIATIAVANPKKEKAAPSANVGADDTTSAFWRWLIHFTDRNPLTVGFSPALNQREVLALYPAAVAVEPLRDSIGDGSPARSDGAADPGWLAAIGETDPVTIGEVIDRCRSDVEARAYFIGRAVAELPNLKGENR